jgi:hypothetical protein
MGPRDAPAVAALTHRLSDCPAEFLEPPFQGGTGVVHVDAIVGDLVRYMGGPTLTAQDTGVFRQGRGADAAARNHLRVVLVASWLLNDPWFAGRRVAADRVVHLLAASLAGVSKVVPASTFVTDPDRREELVRLCLRDLDVCPAGEEIDEAADRLSALNSVERQRVAAEAKKAEERAERIREAMKKKEAEEAAARYGRE